MTSVLGVVVTLVLVGVLLWAINTYVPMDAKVKRILNVFVVIALVIGLLHWFGIFDALGHLDRPVPRVR